jgi:hypothetical protein
MAFAGVTPTAVAHGPWLAVDDVAWADRHGTRIRLTDADQIWAMSTKRE